MNHEQFPIQMTQNCKHSKCLQILAEKDFPLKLLERTQIKIYRRADRRRQPRSRELRFSTAKATSSTQRPQTTEAATKYYNYIVKESVACVAGVRKGRGRELGRESTRERGGRRGTPARKPFSVFAIPPTNKKKKQNNATVND